MFGSRIVALKAVSLVFTLIANLVLLLNMAMYMPFYLAQPLTILSWYASGFILIGLVAFASRSRQTLQPDEAVHYTQGFYYATFSAGLYIVIATLLVVSFYGAFSGRYSREFKLAMGQMPLMLQTICFQVYLLGGAAIFHVIEGWTFLDAVYWADYTILTIGIGDFAPKTHLGRSLLFPYAVGGVMILGLIVASIQSFVTGRRKERLRARTEKAHLDLLNRGGSAQYKGHTLSRFLKGKNRASKVVSATCPLSEEEFHLMRTVQAKVARRHQWNLLCASATAWFLLWLLSAAVFQKAERAQEWTYFQALYFTYTSLMTIGYGDLYPSSNLGKAFFVFWSLLAVPILTFLISVMGDTVIRKMKESALCTWRLVLAKSGLGSRTRESQLPQTRPSLHRKSCCSFKDNYNLDPLQQTEAQNSASRRGSRFAEDDGERIARDYNYYHYLLANEISNVAAHLRTTPGRKYTYEEWTWFLTLISQRQFNGGPKRLSSQRGAQQNERTDESGTNWIETEKGTMELRSWFGSQSPTMGEIGEPTWVLERLAGRLMEGLGQYVYE